MPKDIEDRIACRTPAEGRDGTSNIPAWKFHLLRDEILTVLGAAGADGMLNKDLRGAVEPQISAADRDRLGKLGWHLVTVKLEMEVRGEIKRLDAKGPLRIALA